jgi:hypothetical protein
VRQHIPGQTGGVLPVRRVSRHVPQFHARAQNISLLRVFRLLHTGASKGANTQLFPASTQALALPALPPWIHTTFVSPRATERAIIRRMTSGGGLPGHSGRVDGQYNLLTASYCGQGHVPTEPAVCDCFPEGQIPALCYGGIILARCEDEERSFHDEEKNFTSSARRTGRVKENPFPQQKNYGPSKGRLANTSAL